ncbi:hypothetical protein [Algoriphagus sanaruensis]|uniref:Outer membrane protein beta-barrel domain-containing protein n=1 Tax=Algoriphagus sanaruensis TaxID=1727163 RepID=A0A142EPN2_9BACT|nr:hypothetical protein [Algoriphagus sanaruensis]AMQ57087.1 hypothetical protein AO498_11620 [Algoriphagus sanaruensis]
MKRSLPLFIFILGLTIKSYSQEIFFRTGLNHTSYNFKDQYGLKITGLLPGVGSSYGLGIGVPFAQEWLKYEFGLTVNSFDATGGDVNNNYSWNTTYGGLTNTVAFYPTSGELSVGILATASAMGMINGTQVINNSRYELRKNPEFSGLLVQPGLGVSVLYNIFNQGYISLQYDYSLAFRLGRKTEETLSYLNNRILFGIHFQLD